MEKYLAAGRGACDLLHYRRHIGPRGGPPATLEFGKENAKRWLKVLNDHWLGPNKPYLCGEQITIADYFGAGIVTLGEIIGVDFTPYPNVKRWLDRMKTLPNWDKVNEAFNGLREAVKGQNFVTLA